MLPRGYIDFDDYSDLDVSVVREVYVKLREIARYTMGTIEADAAIKAFAPVTPNDWCVAVKRVECSCHRCKGSGIYEWGACINGRMSKSAPCARCGGNGRMTFDDMRRGMAYDMYAISRALRG